MVEAHPSGEDHSPAPKWLGWMNRFNGFDPRIRLDRIYTRGIEVTDCYSHAGVTSSDHLPLVMCYRVLSKEDHSPRTLPMPRSLDLSEN